MQNIDEIRERIYSLLGKHLIRFQTIEMRLKSLVKMNRTIISKPNDLPLIIEPSVQNQTLGGLTTKALNSLFLVNPSEEDTIIPEPEDALRLDMKGLCCTKIS
ncbi:hypothetical protein [Acinetobacter schindleri]|uniref:hypothetical protein n=1 Tax=Acinetobacter schindleri TaxID=108981 RepID=UPI001D0F26FA|nr:hypothetical protein [Acinetobacter schindleri]